MGWFQVARQMIFRDRFITFEDVKKVTKEKIFRGTTKSEETSAYLKRATKMNLEKFLGRYREPKIEDIREIDIRGRTQNRSTQLNL